MLTRQNLTANYDTVRNGKKSFWIQFTEFKPRLGPDKMIEQVVTSGDLLKMADLDELNGAFYDIDAQDLLDVWEAMDTWVRLPILNTPKGSEPP